MNRRQKSYGDYRSDRPTTRLAAMRHHSSGSQNEEWRTDWLVVCLSAWLTDHFKLFQSRLRQQVAYACVKFFPDLNHYNITLRQVSVNSLFRERVDIFNLRFWLEDSKTFPESNLISFRNLIKFSRKYWLMTINFNTLYFVSGKGY